MRRLLPLALACLVLAGWGLSLLRGAAPPRDPPPLEASGMPETSASSD